MIFLAMKIKKMNRSIVFFSLISIQWMVYAQTEPDFEKFISEFPYVNYPYVASEDWAKMTKVDAYAQTIEKKFHEKFVIGQGIKPVGLGCSLKEFVAYKSYIQLPSTDSVYLLVLSPEMTDPACRGGDFLVTYSKFNQQLQDTLWISYQGGFEISRTSEQQKICGVDIESVLTGDTIFLERKHTYVVRIGDLRSKYKSFKAKITIYQYKYVMTVGGRFKQVSVNRKDEILNEELAKLFGEDPPHRM